MPVPFTAETPLDALPVAADRAADRAAAPDAGRGAAPGGARRLRVEGGGVVPWLFVAPALGTLLVFLVLPVLAAGVLSLTDFDLYGLADPSTVRFVGLKNYRTILANGLFWTALGNTLYFVAVGGPLSVAVSLGAALLVSHPLARFRGAFRTAFFAPVVTTLVAVAVVFRYLYHPTAGLLNYALGTEIDWLGDPDWAMPALILLAVWKNFGYNMVIFIAGLMNVPEELYEAARIDGAGAWQRFRYVTLPALAPTFLFVGLLTMIGYFQFFAEPYVMTQGGPVNRTLSVVLLMYQEGFRWWNIGYAAALAFVLFALVFAATLVQLRLQKRGQGDG